MMKGKTSFALLLSQNQNLRSLLTFGMKWYFFFCYNFRVLRKKCFSKKWKSILWRRAQDIWSRENRFF